MPSNKVIKQRLETSREYNKRQHKRWEDAVKLYKGEITAFRSKALPQWQHMIEVNFCRPIIDTMLPSIVFRTPKVIISTSRELAQNPEVKRALEIENEVNAIQVELQMAREFKRATKDALMLGIGWVKYGMSDHLGYDVDKYGVVAPFIKRASPWDIFIDPACREPDLSDCDYYYHRSIVPLVAAEKDELLKNKDKLRASLRLEDLPESYRENLEKTKGEHEFVELYELWDRRDQVFEVIDTDGNVFRREPWPYNLHGTFNIVPIAFNHVPDEFYAPGESEFIYAYQLEASEKRTQQLNHTRRFNRKYQVPLDVQDDDLEALRKGGDGTIVKSNNPINPIADAPLSQDLYQEYRMIQSEVREVTGVSAYQRGGNEQGVYSATAARIIDAAANIRIEERRMEIANAMSEGARILYDILAPINKWPELPFKFTVDISTMQRPDDEGRRQQLMQFGQMAQPFPEFKRQAWLSDVALSFHKPPEQYLYSEQEMAQMAANQPPDPAQQKAQVEMQKIQAQMQADAQKMQMELQIEQQKLQIEAQKGQMQLEMMQQKMELERQKAMMELEMERQKLGLEREKMGIEREKATMGLQVQQAKSQQAVQAGQDKLDLQRQQGEQALTHQQASGEQALTLKEKESKLKTGGSRGKKSSR